jgi:hypothetical protein
LDVYCFVLLAKAVYFRKIGASVSQNNMLEKSSDNDENEEDKFVTTSQQQPFGIFIIKLII